MRTIYDQNGNNVTSSIQAALQAGRSFRMANLYTFAQRDFWSGGSQVAFWGFTDADIPISITSLQLFGSGANYPIVYGFFPLGSGQVILPTSGSASSDPGLSAGSFASYSLSGGSASFFYGFHPFPNIPMGQSVSLSSYGPAITSGSAVWAYGYWNHQTKVGSALFGAQLIVNGTTVINFPPSPPGPAANGSGFSYVQVGIPSTFPYSTVQFNAGLGANLEGLYDDFAYAAAGLVVVGGPGGGAGGGSPVGVPFVPETIKRGKLSYQVGFEASEIEVDWYIDDTKNYFGSYSPLSTPAVSQLSMKEAMTRYRAFDDCPFWIHTVLIPDGPLNASSPFYTTLMYRGFIRKVEAAADYVKITVGSLMQIIQDTQIPGQLIMPGNRDIQFLSSQQLTPTLIGAPFTVNSPLEITFTATGTLTTNQLQDCWLTFNNQTGWVPLNGLPPSSMPGWRVRTNTAATSGGNTILTFYDPPIIPGTPTVFNIFTQTAGVSPGFPYVPPPENSL